MHGATIHAFIPREERTEDEALLGDVAVDLDDQAAPIQSGGAFITELADGSTEISFGDPDPIVPVEGSDDHYANLAEHLTRAQRMSIAQDILEMVDADRQSRRRWNERMAKGLELVGICDEQGVAPPFPGASTVVHPLIAEGIIQGQSRALAELFPATGPAKSVVMGTKTREKEERARRVDDYQNYQLTMEDKTYFTESDKLLFLVWFEGSAFRKVYHDPMTDKNVSRIVRAEHFIVPYAATTLEDSPRYTHEIRYSQQEMKRLQLMGFFVNDPLSTPLSTTETSDQPLEKAKADAEGKEDPDTRPEDREHVVYEMTVDYVIPGFEDRDEEGKETGIAYPYVISVERDSMVTLGIRRAWKPDDPTRTRRIQFVHYPCINGDGFYAYGLIHLAGGLGKAATGTLRVILDNAAFAAMQGGFTSKDARLPSDVVMTPGKYHQTDMSAEELSKCFYTPPFKDVPVSLFQVLNLLTEHGQRLVSTTEATVGDARNTGPVGTTVALIEQGSKIQTAIHKRLHVALGQELRLLADLNFEHIPEGGYPYDVPGESREIFREDFDPTTVDVAPVSDPNIFSQTQRISIAQAGLELAKTFPHLYDIEVANRRMLEAIRYPDADEIMVPEQKIERCDPVTENALATVGRPIKVFLDQNHEAHNAVHMAELEMAAAQKAPHMQVLQQVLMPHMAEHAAMGMRIKMMQALGVQLPPLNLTAERGEPYTMPLPPQAENMIAIGAAQVMSRMVQEMRAAMAQAQQAQEGQERGKEDADFAAEQRRKDLSAKAEEHRKDIKTMTEIERQDAKAGIDPNLVRDATQYLSQRGLIGTVTPRQLAVFSKEFGRNFDDAIQLLLQVGYAGQGQGPAPIASRMGVHR